MLAKCQGFYRYVCIAPRRVERRETGRKKGGLGTPGFSNRGMRLVTSSAWACENGITDAGRNSPRIWYIPVDILRRAKVHAPALSAATVIYNLRACTNRRVLEWLIEKEKIPRPSPRPSPAAGACVRGVHCGERVCVSSSRDGIPAEPRGFSRKPNTTGNADTPFLTGEKWEIA